MTQDEYNAHYVENVFFKNDTICIVKNTKSGTMCFFINDNPIGMSLIAYGEWAGQELDLFNMILSETSNCIDIGANIGTHTTWLSAKCKLGTIYSIEPQFNIFQILNANLVLNSCMNVFPTNAFIGSKTENIMSQIINPYMNPAAINYGEYNKTHALWSSGEEDLEKIFLPIKKKTPVIRLDDLDIHTSIDFIKIDCEGSEYDILLSGIELIKEFKPHLYMEHAGTEYAESGIITLLESHGYNCYWHIATKYNPENYRNSSSIWGGQRFEGNIICIHKDKDVGLFTDRVLSEQDNIFNWLTRNGKI